MKPKLHLATLAALLVFTTTAPVHADLLWYEGFNYPDGQIMLTSTNLDGTTNWVRHSGSGNDALVKNNRLENSATGGTVSRQDDVNRRFPSAYANSQITVYASLTVICTNLPDTDGGYFVHFNGLGGNQLGRVYAIRGGLPGTWRLGIAAAAGTANQVFPVDLATNVEYQAVFCYNPDPLVLSAKLWVNPLSSGDLNFATSDPVTGSGANQILGAFASRQAGSFGNAFFIITNLATATTFEEAATNVWSTNAVPPFVASSPQTRTNFVGDSVNLIAVAGGQGLGGLTYEWRKDGNPFTNPNNNSNVLSFASVDVPDTGNYEMVVTTPYGLSATSSVAFLWVTNPPVPPTITQHPASTNVYPHQTATFSVAAGGVGLSYLWYYENNPATGPNVSGADTPTLTVTDVQNGNGTTGIYRCDVGNTFGTTPSSNATLAVLDVPMTNIAYLRGLVDSTFYLPTNTRAYWSASGVVTVHTNLTGPPNASFVIQDDTAGIGVFMAGGSANLPAAGDNITVTGPLGNFNGALQFALNASDLSTFFVTNSSANALPPGIVLPLTFTNGMDYGGVSNVFRQFMGSVITLTNVYFPDGLNGASFGSGQNTVTMTNQNGDTFRLFLNAAVGPNFGGLPIPPHAWTVTGPLTVFLSQNDTNRTTGFQITPSRYEDIVTNAPPAATGAIALAGADRVITWTAQPYMSYSILQSANLEGPYTPLATGLTFNHTAGSYTDTSDGADTRFYLIVSP